MNRRELITGVGKGVVAAGVVAAVSSVAPRVAEASTTKAPTRPAEDGGLYIRIVKSCQGEEPVWLVSKTPFGDADPERTIHI